MQTPAIKHSLKQRHLLFGSREFIVRGEDSLLIREKSLLRYQETLLPLNTLHANPTHATSFAIKWLLLGLFSSTISGLTTYAAWHLDLNALYLFAAVMAGSAIVTLYRFFLYTTKLTIFRHIVSNENYVYLWRNRPGKRSFETFINELSRLIRQSQT